MSLPVIIKDFRSRAPSKFPEPSPIPFFQALARFEEPSPELLLIGEIDLQSVVSALKSLGWLDFNPFGQFQPSKPLLEGGGMGFPMGIKAFLQAIPPQPTPFLGLNLLPRRKLGEKIGHRPSLFLG